MIASCFDFKDQKGLLAKIKGAYLLQIKRGLRHREKEKQKNARDEYTMLQGALNHPENMFSTLIDENKLINRRWINKNELHVMHGLAEEMNE
mgnify:CR=1 FL=1